MNKFHFPIVLALFMSALALAQAPEGQKPPPGPGSGKDPKEMLAEKIRRDEFHLAMDKMKMKYMSASTDKEKAVIVTDARKMLSDHFDEQKAAMEKNLAKMQANMKAFELHRELNLQSIEKILKGEGGFKVKPKPEE